MLKNKDSSSITLIFMSVFIFFMSVGEGLTAPAIPLYGDILGASYAQLGFLMTGYSIAYAAMTVTAGRASDYLGRKRILLVSIILAIIASAGYYFSTTPIMLLIFRTIEGMSRGIMWPISETIVMDNAPIDKRGRAMGIFSASYGAGVTLGTFSGGYIMELFGITAVLPFYPLLGIIVFITSLIGVTEKRKNIHETHQLFSLRDSKGIKKEIKKIWPVCYGGFAYAGMIYTVWGLLSKVADIYGVAPSGIGLIYSAFWVARLLSFILVGNIADKYGRKKIYLFGILMCLFSTGTFIIAKAFQLLLLAAFLGGVGTGIIFPMCITLVADYATPDYRGFAMGFLELSMAIGMIIQTTLSGIIGDLAGASMTFLPTFISMLAAIPLTAIFVQDTIKRKQESISC